MSILIAGVILFFLIHMVTMFPAMRAGMVSAMGEGAYKGLFAVIAFGAVGLMIYGRGLATFVPVYQPVPAMEHLAKLLVLIAFILLPAAHMKTNIKRFTRHPMLWGVALWGIGHLLANGDLASVWLFGGFVVFAFVMMISANLRGAQKSTDKYPLSKDAMVVVAGLVVYGMFTWFHGALFGYPLL